MKIKNIILAALCCCSAATLFTACCEDEAKEVTSLSFSRAFSPIDFSGTKNGAQTGGIVFSWDMPKAGTYDYFIVEVYESTDGTSVEITDAMTPVGGQNPFYGLTGEVDGLVSGTAYTARIKAVKDGIADSKWTVLEKVVKAK